MAVWDSEIEEIPPFDEEWLDPFDEGSLFDCEIMAQLYRGYNKINDAIGTDRACDVHTRPNAFLYPYLGALHYPTGIQIALVPEFRMPLGQYINFTAKMLGELFNELTGFVTYYASGDGDTEVVSSVTGFKVADDRYWQIYNPDHDTSSNYRNSLIEIIEEVDPNVFNSGYSNNPTLPPIASATFNLKCKWGSIIKILQEAQSLFKFKKSRKYTRAYAGVSIEYIDGSAEYPFENFSYIQKTGETIFLQNQGTRTWVYLDDEDGYMFPGNNGHNWCPDVKTQYSNADIYALPSWEEDVYAYNIFRTGENGPNWEGLSQGNWAISGFDSQAGNGHPNGSQMYFFTSYYCQTVDSPCGAHVAYEAGYQRTYQALCLLRNVGWFKMAGSRRKYRLKVRVNNGATLVSQIPIADLKVVPTFTVFPDVAGRNITVTGNEFTFYNTNQTSTMTITAELTGAAYLAQPIFPLPSPGHTRTYGASIRFAGMKYYLNGTELKDIFGRSTNAFAMFVSPCGKAYLDYSSL